MLYLVSYDIPNDKRRTKLSNLLKNFGDRVQYSVFECILSSALHGKMVDGINQLIDEKEDSVRVYALCAACEKQVKIFGQGETSRVETVYII